MRRAHEQIIDLINPDTVAFAGWDAQAKEKSLHLVEDFRTWIEAHRGEITALQLFYG